MKKELKININIETDLSFYLATIINDSTYHWFYERFINVAMISSGYYSVLNFVDNKGDESYRSMMQERIEYPYEEILSLDVAEFLKDKVNRKFYSYTWVDKYYVLGNDSYKNDHFIHPVIIYGYDDETKEFFCIDLNFNSGVVSNKIRFNEIDDAIKAINENTLKKGGDNSTLNNTIKSYKLINSALIKSFDINIFISELNDYLCSRINQYKMKELYFYDKNIVFGISVYDRFIEVINRFREGYYLPFKSLNDFMLHKKYMYDRLLYIQNNFQLENSMEDLINKYKGLSDEITSLRSLNLKYNVIDGRNPASLSHNPKFLHKMIDMFTNMKKKEEEILSQVYNILIYGIDNKNNGSNIIQSINIEYECNTGYRDNAIVTLNSSEIIQKIRIYNNSEISNILPNSEIIINDKSTKIYGHKLSLNKYIDVKVPPGLTNKIVYKENEKIYGSTRDLGFKLYKVSSSYIWDWTQNTYMNCLPIERYNKKAIELKINNNDPYINNIFDDCLDAMKAKYIYIKYKTNSNSEIAQFYFKTNLYNTFDRTTTKYFTVSSLGEEFEYIIDMSDVKQWGGMIETMRFDPISYDTSMRESTCNIEYIKITPDLPVYNSFDNYISTQGVNGWFYYTFDYNICYREMLWDDKNNSYICSTNKENLWIKQNTQSSYGGIVTARRWVCPADGKYKINVFFHQLTDHAKTYFTIKRYINVVKEFASGDYINDYNHYEIEVELLRGEYYSFEYYNENYNNLDELELSINIEKLI